MRIFFLYRLFLVHKCFALHEKSVSECCDFSWVHVVFLRSSMKKSIRKTAPSPPVNQGILREVSEEREDHVTTAITKPPQKPKYSSDESSEDEEDTRMLEGNVYTKSGIEVTRAKADILNFYLRYFPFKRNNRNKCHFIFVIHEISRRIK